MTSAEELNERMRTLWQKFRPLMLKRLAIIEQAISTLKDGPLPERLKTQAAHEAHKLAGSLGTFGLEAGSVAAQEIERLLSDVGITDEAVAADISRHFDRLRQEIEGRSSIA